jgi:hypothetical protein
MIAALAGAGLGTVSVLAVYLLMRPDSAPVSNSSASSPFGGGSASPAAAPPVAPPAAVPEQSPPPRIEAPPPAEAPPAAQSPAPVSEQDDSRPAASFASAPHSIVTGEAPSPAAKPEAAAAAVPAPADARKTGAHWTFSGTVFDLLTARGVFGAKLVFLDSEGDVVGETDTGPAGRYKITIPAGTGYTLKISHGDYTGRYIDEDDAAGSLRNATPEERRILMNAAARNLPWKGDPKKPVRRDLALVPRTPEEP